MTRLAGVHVLVTGGSSGIGLAVAEQCVDRGSAVSIVARDAGRLAAARDALTGRRRDARAASAPADVADPAALREAIRSLIDAQGPIDVLVTSAGYAHPGQFTELDDAVFRDQMEVDYFGTLHAVRAVVPSMIERRRGHLVLVASTVAFVGIYGYSAYAPAKHAVRGLAESLRPELKGHGIVVSCAYPPDTETPGLARENEHKPDVTKRISGGITPRSAGAVAAAIVRGIEHDRRVITADPTTAALARTGGLVAPLLHSILDRHLDRHPDR
ncbi:MAG: putative short chain dehydrogenase/reductase [Acidimicrobiia bacterium]